MNVSSKHNEESDVPSPDCSCLPGRELPEYREIERTVVVSSGQSTYKRFRMSQSEEIWSKCFLFVT